MKQEVTPHRVRLDSEALAQPSQRPTRLVKQRAFDYLVIGKSDGTTRHALPCQDGADGVRVNAELTSEIDDFRPVAVPSRYCCSRCVVQAPLHLAFEGDLTAARVSLGRKSCVNDELRHRALVRVVTHQLHQSDESRDA